MTATQPNPIGRTAAIVVNGQCYVGEVIDKVAGTAKPKRVRVKNDPFLQGKVLQPTQYHFKQWIDDDE